jgi:hypothetical protein
MPLYTSFGTVPLVTPFNLISLLIDVNAKNTDKSYGAEGSRKMDFSGNDRAPCTH